MGTKLLLEHVKNVVNGKETESWLPSTINSFCDRINLLSKSEIADLEMVFFELRFWLRDNTGHFLLRDAMATLERKLVDDGRALRIKAHCAIGLCYPYSKDSFKR